MPPQTTITDRISSAKVYLEPDLYYIAQRVADKDDETLSSWIRKLILRELLSRNEVSPDLIMKLAVG